jgi:UMF1 family MFS transporter
MLRQLKKPYVSWALYDWANSAFATTVIAGFFPIFFKSYWAKDLSVNDSTALLGITSSAVALILATSSPFLGTISDLRKSKKTFLFAFTIVAISCTSALFWLPPGTVTLPLVIYAMANIGFSAALIFYDGLLPAVAKQKSEHWVSAFGFSLGYLGGGLLFAVNVAMTLKPHWFFLDGQAAAVRWSFLSVGVWWLVFSIPLFLNVREPGTAAKTSSARGSDTEKQPRETSPLEPNARSFKAASSLSLIHRTVTELRSTFRVIFSRRDLGLFLLGYILYIDGVNTTIKMAVDYGMALGFEQGDLIGALLLVQFIGFPAALGFGWIAGLVGARAGIFIAIAVYCLAVVGAYFMQSSVHFYALAVAIGLVQGGIQALSRSHFASFTPEGKSAEYFGIFNMVGKFSAIFGPAVVGGISAVTGSARLSILSLLFFFALGGLLLFFSGQGKVQQKPSI